MPNASCGNTLWVITSYFNPIGYRRRLNNFRMFRRHLQVPLVAVELAYGTEFELQSDDADILVQLRGGAVLWQKERLLNVALQALPAECRKVAWIDCDVIFAMPNWCESARSLLDHHPIIQLFKEVHYLSPHWTPGAAYSAEFARPSSAYALACGIPAATCIGHLSADRKGTSANGFAWAAQREIVDRHGFFDACIIGGGDRAMSCAANQCIELLVERHCMNDKQRHKYLSWARPFSESVRATTAFLDGTLYHLWHGEIGERGTRTRHAGLRRFEFDPFTDIAKDENGAWRWNSDKPEMHEYVERYFASRREDG